MTGREATLKSIDLTIARVLEDPEQYALIGQELPAEDAHIVGILTGLRMAKDMVRREQSESPEVLITRDGDDIEHVETEGVRVSFWDLDDINDNLDDGPLTQDHLDDYEQETPFVRRELRKLIDIDEMRRIAAEEVNA